MPIEIGQSNANRRDAKLHCAACRKFTLHMFTETKRLGDGRTIDVMYECTACGCQRVWGRETLEWKNGWSDA